VTKQINAKIGTEKTRLSVRWMELRKIMDSLFSESLIRVDAPWSEQPSGSAYRHAKRYTHPLRSLTVIGKCDRAHQRNRPNKNLG
jgi:hypothetical protein